MALLKQQFDCVLHRDFNRSICEDLRSLNLPILSIRTTSRQHDIAMNSTTTDFKEISIPVDHDARNIAIVYGSLGTLIAFGSLIFAILSWMRSRHQRLAAHRASNDVELDPMTPQDTVCAQTEPQGPKTISHRYLYANKKTNFRSKLTSHSDYCQTTLTHPATDTAQPQSPFELQGDVSMPPNAHESQHVAESTDTHELPSGTPDTSTPVPILTHHKEQG